jgi:hypothetical protein
MVDVLVSMLSTSKVDVLISMLSTSEVDGGCTG